MGGVSSTWKLFTSGISQGSVFGPILLLVFINDIDNNISNRILKFADDTKLFGQVNNQEQIESMQRDIDSLGQWADNWQMQFNVSKCKKPCIWDFKTASKITR